MRTVTIRQLNFQKKNPRTKKTNAITGAGILEYINKKNVVDSTEKKTIDE